MKCDVLVVGAGASGSVSALELANKNIDVVVIEKGDTSGSNIGERIDITEDMGIKKIIEKLNLPVKERTNKTKWFSPNHEISLKSNVNDLFFKRGLCEDSFEVINMKKAKKKGVKFITGIKIKKINLEGDYVKEITISKDKKCQSIEPKVVIAADGTESIILREFATKLDEKNINRLIAYGFFSRNINIEPSITHIFFDSTNVPGGYFFLAKSKSGGGVASIVLDNKRLKKQAKEYFDYFIGTKRILKKAFSDIKDKKIFHGSCNINSINSRSIGNVLFAGDAGRFSDPLFGYGMRNSIISGFLAAKTSNEFIQLKNEAILRKFDKELKPVVSDIEKSYSARKIFNNLDNKSFDEIFSILSSNNKIEKNKVSAEVELGLNILSPIFE